MSEHNPPALNSRPLTGLERALALSAARRRFHLAGALRLRPSPDPRHLRSAIDDLQQRQPLLRACIAQPETEPEFHILPDAPPLPLRVVADAGPDHWRARVEGLLAGELHQGDPPLLQFELLPHGDSADLLFQAHHALLDGAGAIGLFDELLRRLAGLPVDQEPLPLGPGPQAVFPRHMRGARAWPRLLAYGASQLAGEVRYQLRTRDTPAPAPERSGRSRLLTAELEPAATRALVDGTRRCGLSLNSALTAAMLWAVWRRRYDARPRPLQAVTFADLRRYMDPPQPPPTLGCYASMLRATVDMDPSATIESVAAAFQEQVLTAGRRGEKFKAARLSSSLMRFLLDRGTQRMGTIALSYLGPLGLEPNYGDIRLEAVHGFISNIDIGPEFTGLAFLSQRRLCWDLVYLDSDMNEAEAVQIKDDMLTLLRELAAPT